MKFFKDIQINDNTIEFTTTHNTNVSIVNAIRRELMSGIEVYALHKDNAIVHINDSLFYTEFLITNRIPMIPINYEIVKNKKLQFYLCNQDNINEPLINNTNSVMHVTLQYFKIMDEKTEYKPDEIFVYPNMEVCWLRPNQKLHLMYDGLKQGNGYEHAMYQNFRINKYTFNPEKENESIKEQQDYEKTSYGDPASIKMEMESLGKINPKTAIMLVLNNIINKINNFMQEINDIGSKTNITMIDDKYAEVIVVDETYTLCNILKYYCIKTIDSMSNNTNNPANYFNIACNEKHPLKKEFILKIQTYDTLDISGKIEFTNIINEACNNAIEDISNIMEEFD